MVLNTSRNVSFAHLFIKMENFMNFFHYFRLPFDTTTYFGFYVAWFHQAFSYFLCIAIFSVYLTFFIGICKYIRVCTDVFENEIRKLNHIQFRRPSNLIKTHSQLRSHLVDLVDFHQKIFDLMNQVQQLMSGPFFKQLCIYTIFIGHSLHSRVTNNN